MVVAFFTFTE